MNNKKRIIIFSISILVFVILIFGTTYAFFNYTRVGGETSLATGQVKFNTTGTLLIDVANDVPQDADLSGTDLTNMKNSHKGTLTMSGHTTLDDGVVYRIYAVRGEDMTGKLRLNDENIKFQLTPNFTSGSNGFTVTNNYYEDPTNLSFDNEGRVLLSTGLVKDTSQLTTVTYDYFMWIDGGNTLISSTTKRATLAEGNPSLAVTTSGNTTADRYMKNDNTLTQGVTIFPAKEEQAGMTVYTTNEFSNGYYNIKIIVEAEDRVRRDTAIVKTIKKDLDTETTINFANASSASNGQGLYLLVGTENDDYPIYYYRGDIDNNNVYFAGFCWQIVRTTETGGTKMIYNGLPDIEGSGNNITYNCGTTRDIQDTIRTTTSLQQSTGYYYADDYEIVSTSGNSVTYKLKSGTNGIHQVAIADASEAATNIPTIVSNYPYTCKQTTDTETCTTLYKVDSYASGTSANVYSSLDRPIIGRSAFNTNSSSVSDVGYMSNKRFTYVIAAGASGAIYGKDIEWDGTNYLVIEDTANTASTNTTKDNDHHYSCGTAGTTSCQEIRYYYYNNYYITLSNGDLLDDTIYKMTGNGTNTTKTKNASYVLNRNNSKAKTAIDNWFRANLTNEVNINNPNYSAYLEDTVYCNDRSFKTEGSSNTYTQSGWNPNGGSLTTFLNSGTHNRFVNFWYSTSNVPVVKNTGEVPNIACPNESDRFTVSNAVGNGALTYPIGLLTVDEIILAGVGGNSDSPSTYYLYTNDGYWSLSPFYSGAGSVLVFSAYNRSLNGSNVGNSGGLRPVVSLKPEIEFETGGEGTSTNPYVVKINNN